MSKAQLVALSAMAAMGGLINAVSGKSLVDLLFAMGFTALTAWLAIAWKEKE